jgi:hypothetical protein
MPDQLYRRCPDCRESESGASCSTCGGKRFIPAGIGPNDIAAVAGDDRPGWRIRIRTLVLLVVIAGVASYIVADQWRRAEDARRLAAEQVRAVAEAQQAQAKAVQAIAEAERAQAATARAQSRMPATAGPRE